MIILFSKCNLIEASLKLALNLWLALIFVQCRPDMNYIDFSNNVEVKSDLLASWELLRSKNNYDELRSEVLDYIQTSHKHKNAIPFPAYYYMAHTYQTGPFFEGIAYCDSALEVSTVDSYLYEKCLVLKGTLLRKSGDYRKSIDFLKPLITQVSNDSVRCEVNWQLSVNYRKKNLYDSAIHYSQSAEKLAIQIGNLKYQSYAIQSMANIHSAMEEYKRALEKEILLVEIAKKIGKPSLILSNMINLAASYFDLNQADSALAYYKRAKQLAEELNDLENQSLLYTIYANHLITSGEYISAKDIMLKAMEYSKKSGRKDHVLRSYYFLSYTGILSQNYKDAIGYAQTGIQIAKESELTTELGSFYELLSSIFQKKKDYKNAFKYSEEFRLLTDSILNVSKLKTIKDLEVKYETEKKEQKIAGLNREAEIRELRLERQNIFIIAAIVLFVVIVIIILLINRQSRLKRQNEIFSLEQRFLRVQMNPHFIFNALGAIQKFVIKNDSMTSSIFLSKFAVLMRQVLQHSREEFITLKEEIETLKNYLDIQKLRFDDQFRFTIAIDDNLDIDELMIPPMFAQPFIENALEHGIAQVAGEGKINICFSKENDQVKLAIQDNGKGFQFLSEQEEKSTSLATKISKERIERLQKLGAKANLALETLYDDNKKSIGALVSLLLPIKKLS